MKTRSAIVAAALIALAAPATAQTGDVLPLVYRAVKVNQAGTSVMVVLPEPFDGYEPTRIDDSLLRAFDALKDAHPYEYGNATLLLSGAQGGARRATINLDPDRSDYWDLVATEAFHTLRGLGASEVRAPAIRSTPLDASAVRLPVALMTVPYYDALPPHRFSNVLVAISPLELLPADLFYMKLQRADRDLLEKVLGGLVSGSEAARLAVLAAFPHLQVDRRASRLIPLLDDPSPGVRLAVLKLLEKEGGREVNDRLSRVVETDEDPSVKLAAVHILSSRGIRRYDVFIEMGKLNDPSDQVVVGAIGRLAASRNPVVATALLRSLRHKSASVREAARRGLMALDAGSVMVKALHDDRVDADSRQILARHLAGSKAADGRSEGLTYLVKSGETGQAVWAAGELGDKRPPYGLKLLYQALLRSEPEVRSAAVRGIGAYRNPVSLKPLLGSIGNDREKVLVEQVAVEIIAAQDLDTILSLMEGRDVTIRRLAMKALGDALKGALPPPRVISVLKARLSDKDLDVRRAAVYALARVPDPRVASSIMKLAGDPDDEIRAAAVVAAAGSRDPEADGILIKALSDPSDKVKASALDGVASRRIQGARESLKMLGQHRNVDVRRKAVTTYLGLLGPGEAAGELDFLTRLLWDRDPGVKLAAIGTVKQVHERRAIIAISGLVIDPSREVKEAAIRALAETHEKDALEGVEKAVFDDDRGIRLLALDSLVTLGHTEALDFLSEVIRMEKDPVVKARAEATRSALMGQ